tara:strand:- start:1681 stop:1902 length:222 start_codon:yes stop_codon:yes gene_type:complete
MAKPIASIQEWLTIGQTAEYLGVSLRGVKSALALKRSGVANNNLVTKMFGVRTLIKRSSLDALERIHTNDKFV